MRSGSSLVSIRNCNSPSPSVLQISHTNDTDRIVVACKAGCWQNAINLRLAFQARRASSFWRCSVAMVIKYILVDSKRSEFRVQKVALLITHRLATRPVGGSRALRCPGKHRNRSILARSPTPTICHDQQNRSHNKRGQIRE